ncbi:MAG TPA: metallophosphoesterase family protein [Pirellulales bacterium]|jgi:hypothetical protein
MLLGVVSDTHGHAHNTQQAIRILESFAPVAVIHCGDIGSAEIVPMFAPWPTHFVLGNVDEGCPEIERAIMQAGQTYHGAFGNVTLAGKRIAFLHGHDSARLRLEMSSGKWDLLCYGHTHQRDQRRDEQGTLVLNPGALYRARPHSLAIVDLSTLDVTSVTL